MNPSIYFYQDSDGQARRYLPRNFGLQDIAKYILNGTDRPWEHYIEEGLEYLRVSLKHLINYSIL